MRRGPAEGAKPDPSRNVNHPRGKIVMVSDVQAYALPKHGKCSGRGLVGDPKTSTTPCACATKRFFKAHPEIIVDKEGRAWWPEEDPVLGG